tara:strand:+ start:253 stop:1068 length:816 start_codon:yes stop_codon:yes gene_type:complete
MIKKKIGIVAEKLNHSLSPTIHKYWSKKTNTNFLYKKYEIDEKRIEKFFYNYKKDKNFIGFNITIPYKEKFIDMCDNVSIRAKKIGSVNLIYKRENKVYGDNTDVIGFGKIFNILKIKKTKTVLLIGAGGASRAILYFLNRKNIENIDIFAKSFRRRQGLSENFKFKNFTNKTTLLKKKYDLIINASNAGMSHGNKINRNILRLVKKTKGVIDIVYNPIETNLLKEAKKHNIKSIGGLIMLVEQAKPSFEVWSKKSIEVDDKIYQSLISKI